MKMSLTDTKAPALTLLNLGDTLVSRQNLQNVRLSIALAAQTSDFSTALTKPLGDCSSIGKVA
jgi:hypothetical protein